MRILKTALGRESAPEPDGSEADPWLVAGARRQRYLPGPKRRLKPAKLTGGRQRRDQLSHEF
jgi:hypothetical protein